jgi:hypothetical protein
MKKDEYFSGFYLISGEDEYHSRVYISKAVNSKLWELEGQKSGSFQMNIHEDQDISLCIENRSDKQVAFGFELNDDNSKEQILSIRNLT